MIGQGEGLEAELRVSGQRQEQTPCVFKEPQVAMTIIEGMDTYRTICLI